jgi:hypothetical protein
LFYYWHKIRMKQMISPAPPEKPAKKHKPKSHTLCDCGRPAQYQQRVMLYRADLSTEVHAIIHLCETCFLLECDLHLARGQSLPRATRIG